MPDERPRSLIYSSGSEDRVAHSDSSSTIETHIAARREQLVWVLA